MKTKTTLFKAVLWFVITGIWIANLGMTLSSEDASTVLIVLQSVCVLSSLITAVSHLGLYRKEQKDKKTDLTK